MVGEVETLDWMTPERAGFWDCSLSDLHRKMTSSRRLWDRSVEQKAKLQAQLDAWTAQFLDHVEIDGLRRTLAVVDRDILEYWSYWTYYSDWFDAMIVAVHNGRAPVSWTARHGPHDDQLARVAA